MNLADAAQWIEQRGTWASSVETLVRDLGVSRAEAHTAIHHLMSRGIIVRVRRPLRGCNQHSRTPAAFALYVHHTAIPERRMAVTATLILFDAAGHERHRAEFPSRFRAEAAQRVVERDLRDGRTTVRIVGVEPTDPKYTITGVARVMLVVDDVAAEPVEFDARARASGDDR